MWVCVHAYMCTYTQDTQNYLKCIKVTQKSKTFKLHIYCSVCKGPQEELLSLMKCFKQQRDKQLSTFTMKRFLLDFLLHYIDVTLET